MKRLIFIGGTMGVGKTAVCRELQRTLPGSVFLDGDWCWDAAPFVVNAETKAMVLDNICHLLQNFLDCSAYENVIFCWVMHQEEIVRQILSELRGTFPVFWFSLTCAPEALRERLEGDIRAGVRQPDVLERSLARLELYSALGSRLVDTTGLSVGRVAEVLEECMEKGHGLI